MANSLRHIATEPANLNHKVMNTERKQRTKSHLHTSDSDLSIDTASLSQESQPDKAQYKLSPSPQMQSTKYVKGLKGDWEIMEGLKDGQRCEEKPDKHEGYLLKRRKWPMKGWHKRFFVLENGILRYAKTTTEMTKGKLHGELDVGLSVISSKLRGRRIDIDAEESIYHLKVKARDAFPIWIGHLKHHRLYRQHEIAFGRFDSKLASPVSETIHSLSPVHSYFGNGNSHPLRSPSFLCQQRVAAWLVESTAMDKFNKDFAETQEEIFNLGTLLEQLDEAFGSSNCDVTIQVASTATSIKRDRKRFLLKRKKNKGTTSDLTNLKSKTLDIPISKADRTQLSMQHGLHKIGSASSSTSLNIQEMTPLSTSNPNLPNMCRSQINFGSIPDSGHSFPDNHLVQNNHEKNLRDHFIATAKETLAKLRSLSRQMQSEKERLKEALDLENLSPSNISSSTVQNNLRTALNQALQQNAELRSRLNKIHAESDLSECSVTPDSLRVARHPSISCESSLSVNEFFDAAENISDSSSEGSATDDEDEGSFTSDNSETGTDCTPAPSVTDCQNSTICTTGRRTQLPVPKPETGDLNLWNLLCRNIGKDLSKISMPVTLNEPLNTLQRLCEELEYCDILDKAAETEDPYERMVLVAAFAVSAYGSSYYRAGHKPFNPLLGETYECIREDRGFRFISEQVCHHPPISTCHAESKNFVFWQDMRIKTTFWGKSMEVQPIGMVHLILPKFNEHYRWNKLTTCIHNLFGGQRWVDLYGELCINATNVKCKLTFSKASYWSNKRHEVHGNIQSCDGKNIHNLFGKWNEALYCGNPPSARCIWRIGAIPAENDRYYGFTRFSIELNELEPDLVKLLPPTDTRFRPDQRLLEEGNVQLAEATKVQLEQAQRDRRKAREDEEKNYEPMWFKKTTSIDGKESWEYAGTYWTTRNNPGFASIEFPQQLW